MVLRQDSTKGRKRGAICAPIALVPIKCRALQSQALEPKLSASTLEAAPEFSGNGTSTPRLHFFAVKMRQTNGDEPMFRCTEIRQNGPCASKPADCKAPCNIAAGFWRAQEAYRQSLSEIDLVTLSRSVAAQLGMEKVMQAGAWIGEHVRSRN